MPIKNYSETIWIPAFSQIVENSYQVKNSLSDYTAPMSALDLATNYGIAITPSNYTYARDTEITYTDFLIETGLNSLIYTSGQLIYIKFKVVYPNSKEVNVVFIITAYAEPA
jgi:hypothetical protein